MTKKDFIFSIVFILTITCVRAQFQDDMESYTEGEPIFQGHWTDWGCGGGVGCAIMSTSEFAHTGELSGKIPNDTTTDAVLDLGNKIFGHWRLEYWVYIPSDREAFMNIKGCVPICTEDWEIYLYFNQNNETPGEGVIMNSINGEVNFTFPHDNWFRIYIDWDITGGMSQATWFLSINNTEVFPYNTPYVNHLGETPISVGGIEFFSISSNSLYYLDNFRYCEEFDPPGTCTLLGGDNVKVEEFKLFPNPVNDILNIQSDTEVQSIEIYNTLGQEMFSINIKQNNYSIDMSNFSEGTYIVNLVTDNNLEVFKVIK